MVVRRRQRLHVLALIAILAASLLMAPVPASAADVLTIQSLPATLQLRGGESTALTLLVTNETATSVELRTVTLHSGPWTRVEYTGEVPVALASRQSRPLVLTVDAEPGVHDTSITVILTGSMPGKSGKKIPVWATSVIKLESIATDSKVRLSLQSFPSELSDDELSSATVLVANDGDLPIRHVSLQALGSRSICWAPATAEQGSCKAGQPGGVSIPVSDLAAHTSTLVPVQLRTSDRVHLGEETLVVTLTGSVDNTGASTMASADAKVKVTVLGLETVAGLGVPVLFLLPGLFAIGLFLTLGRYLYPRRVTLPDLPDFKDPTALAWLAPLALLAYATLSVRVGASLVTTTGRSDLLLFLLLGSGVGVGGWLLLVGIYFLRTERKIFKRDDPPVKVLRRIGLRRGSLKLDEVAGPEPRRLRLGEVPGGIATVPPIEYIHPDGVSPEKRTEWRTALKNNDLLELARLAKLNVASLHWLDPAGVAVNPAADLRTVDPPQTGALLREGWPDDSGPQT